MDLARLLDGNGHTVAAIVAGVVSIALSVVITGVVIVRLPADHFACDHRPSKSFARRALRNVGGALLIALGLVMSVPGVPGQGVLTILLGIMCLDVAGKRRLELWLVRKPSVRHATDRLRARYGKPPLSLPDEACPSPGPAADERLPASASRRDSTT